VFPAALTEHRSVSRGADSLSLLGLSSDVQMFQLAEQRLTQLMMGDKSERAQKVFGWTTAPLPLSQKVRPLPRHLQSRERAACGVMASPGAAQTRRAGAGALGVRGKCAMPIGRSASGALSGISMPRL